MYFDDNTLDALSPNKNSRIDRELTALKLTQNDYESQIRNEKGSFFQGNYSTNSFGIFKILKYVILAKIVLSLFLILVEVIRTAGTNIQY